MSDTLNMREITIEQFIDEIEADIEDENYDPVIGIGKSGIGKTMSIYELTQKLGIGFCELRLVTMTEIDILGIPVVENGRTTYASNALLPSIERDGERGILVLDEITSAERTVRAAAYQLLDSKRALGNYKLPDKWKVVALGNGVNDGGVFQGMEAAFLSRATCYRPEPNFDCWKRWALKNGINTSVIAYLSFDPTKLHQFDTDEFASVFPCPRSWVSLSKRLNAREKKNNGKPLDTDKVALYAAGAVGEKEADLFAGFYEYNGKTVSADDILSGKSQGNIVGQLEPQVAYLVIQNLAAKVRETLGDRDDSNIKPEEILIAVRATNWLLDAAEFRLDFGITGLADLVNSSVRYTTIALQSDDFERQCPRFLEFAYNNNLALGGVSI